jgi:hypothetical protein
MRSLLNILFILFSFYLASAREKSLIGSVANIPKIERELDGCSCNLDSIYVSTFDGKTAWMNIDGKIVKLSITKSTEPSSKKRTFYRFYQTKSFSVSIKFKVVIRPKAPNESEESDGYEVSAVLTFIKGNHKEIFKVSGVCGC